MQEQTLSDNGGECLNSGAETSRSEYFRYDHSFIPGERVRGSFVRFDKMGTGIKVYALFDLEDGRKTRADVKYLESLNGREAIVDADNGAKTRVHPRFKHVIEDPVNHRLRRLIPLELERLDMFPDNHTIGQNDVKRAFFMGNALVCGIVTKVGEEIKNRLNN